MHWETHVLLELKDCNPKVLDELPLIRSSLVGAVEEIGATILGETFHKFSPQGVTGIVAIAESHLCIHTWPEYGYAAVDIFTCGENFDPEKAVAYLIQRLECNSPGITELKRGIQVAHLAAAGR